LQVNFIITMTDLMSVHIQDAVSDAKKLNAVQGQALAMRCERTARGR